MNDKILAFDLDGTLAKSKGPIDQQMTLLLKDLLREYQVCVISGGQWKQFQDQLISKLDHRIDTLDNLHCFPTCGTQYYRFEHPDWNRVYQFDLSAKEKRLILKSFEKVLDEVNWAEMMPDQVFGEIFEDRGSQITFSAAGQEAPYEIKKDWDPNRFKRKLIINHLEKYLPDFDVRLGGTTSIDVTHKGCDKSLAVRKIQEFLNCSKHDLIFFGDALEPGGNDHAVYQSGVECIPVNDHIDCVWKVKLYLRSLGDWRYV